MGELGTPTRATNDAARPTVRLLRVGGKLATLGVALGNMRYWHVARPGTIGHPDALTRLTYATSLCRRNIVTNGYASDFAPPVGVLCPACQEQL